MAFVRLLKELIKDEEIGPRFVPIIPDEARTFGMDSLFPTTKIYNPHGQHYTSVDRELILAYKESEQGQILHEGINEAGSTASFTAAGTSYATHGEPMIPIYIFYSMFGFQRTGDEFWAAADQMARGFLLGATAGRTTLNGEGLQHEDGHSLLLAATNPGVVAYDPAFSFEVAHITEDALVRMYGEDPGGPLGGHRSPDVMYYLTVYNEPFQQPAEPEGLDVQGLLAGMYRYAEGPQRDGAQKAQMLASGVAVPWALRAQELLAQDWNVSADVWSVTSWTELRRDAVEAEEHNLLHPEEEPRVPYVTQRLRRGRRARSSRCRTGCGRCPTSSRRTPRTACGRWAPTGSACPTPARRCAGTSTSTPSRSSSARWPRWPTGAGWTATSSARRWRSTRSATCRPRRPTPRTDPDQQPEA